MTRIEGWEQRLQTVLVDTRVRTYRQGQADCIRLVCECVEAITGQSLWPRWSGKYDDRRGALVLIAKTADYEKPYLTRAVSNVLRVEPCAVALLQRGDVVEWNETDGPHLGVVTGTEAAGFGPDGLYFVPVRSCAHGWRVG